VASQTVFTRESDHFLDWPDAPLPIFVGDADSARMLLSIIGGAVATLLALVFTVITVVIQMPSRSARHRVLSRSANRTVCR
jgi:uncharacterized membrane protein